MKTRPASRLAWSASALVLALVVATVVLVVLNRDTVNVAIMAGYALALPSSLAYATVGGLVASRQPHNPIGWFFVIVALSVAAFSFTNEYGVRAYVTAPGSLPAPRLVAWLNGWVFVPPWVLVPMVFLLFPSGRLLSRGWRLASWPLAAGILVIVAGVILREGATGGRLGDLGIRVENPTGVGFPDVGIGIGVILVAAGWLAGGVALLLRYRRAAAEERQQLRWLAYIGVVPIAEIPLTILGPGWILAPAATAVLGLGIPIASGIAILKYRLYDLDIVIKKTVVAGVLATFIALVYLGVVFAVPLTIRGTGGRPADLFSLAAAAIVALAFNPVRGAARRLADRLVYGERASPYEVLSEFSERVAETYSTDDVLPRMAQIVAAGTGATEAAIWLRVGSELRPAASWPGGARAGNPLRMRGEELPDLGPQTSAFPVRHQGELLGAVSVTMPANDPMNPSKEALVRDLASQAGLVLRNVRLIEELRASRQRIVAAQDQERRRIERDIHDGAQQQLVALSVKLRLLEQLTRKDANRAAALAAELQAEANEAMQNLRDLARGIYPPLLSDKGLVAALEGQARKANVPVEIDGHDVGRYPQDVESTVYFCVLEALQNVAKYARASRVSVRLAAEDGQLRFDVTDDGVGFDPEAETSGTGLQSMADRVEAIGGTVEIRSEPGHGTTIRGRVLAREGARPGPSAE